MHAAVFLSLFVLGANPEQLQPGNHSRTIQVDGRQRSYLVHVPATYDLKTPTPVVLVLHGAWTNGPITAIYSGLNLTADEHNFIAVYPNGTGIRETALFWNCGGRDVRPFGRELPDDVNFIGRVLDDLATVANNDRKRIYATGISNGGMMCYRLAGELSDRIAAIAPISGTLCQSDPHPQRPVPVLHFHGTDDQLVRYDGGRSAARDLLNCMSVDDTIRTWAKLDGCPEKPRIESLSKKIDDGTTVRRHTFGPGKAGSEVVLMEITGGGHTWPDRPMVPLIEGVLGRTTHQFSANDMLWDFFQKHPMP